MDTNEGRLNGPEKDTLAIRWNAIVLELQLLGGRETGYSPDIWTVQEACMWVNELARGTRWTSPPRREKTIPPTKSINSSRANRGGQR